MTLPPVVRVFFAIELPEAMKEDLGRYIGMLKKKSRTKSIRWVRSQNLHITLQFLAGVQSEHLPRLLAAVRAAVTGKLGRSLLKLGAPQLFPNPYRPRVIVLDVAPQAEMAALSKLIGEGIQAAQYEIEERTFRAHLTLGRIKQPHGLDLRFLSELEAPEVEALRVERVALFRSEPQPEGSVYSVLERVDLL